MPISSEPTAVAPRRVLVLNGSPHRARSTTLQATNAFLSGLTEGGDYAAETVHLSSLHVTPCTGCLSCWGRTPGECVIRNDDIAPLKAKILAADTLIISFPLYFFGMPGEMKVVLDRLLSLVGTYRGQDAPRDGAAAHTFRTPLGDRRILLFCGCAFTEAEAVCAPLLAQADLILGHDSYTAVLCPQLKTEVDYGGGRMERTRQRFIAAGREMAQTGRLSAETVQQLSRPPFSPAVYRTVLGDVWAAEEARGLAARAGGQDEG